MLRLLLVKKSDSASMQIVTGGSYGRLLGMSRISGSDKLAVLNKLITAEQQANCAFLMRKVLYETKGPLFLKK